MARRKSKPTNRNPAETTVESSPILVWLKAVYHFHTFAYRDPRSAFSSGVGLPVVSPTTILLGIASTLFSLGEGDRAGAFLQDAHYAKVIIDPPESMIFFRAFHQLRRYESGIMKVPKKKFKPNARLGLTLINQGTREYGLPHGNITIYIGVPAAHLGSATLALINRDHVGTHDSLCSLVGSVEICDEPKDVIYIPIGEKFEMPQRPFTVVTLSRFKTANGITPTVGKHWWMAGGDNTELVPYLIRGRFRGTSRGKIYRKF